MNMAESPSTLCASGASGPVPAGGRPQIDPLSGSDVAPSGSPLHGSEAVPDTAGELQAEGPGAAPGQKAAGKKSAGGLLGGWLLRSLKAGASTPPDGAIIAPEPETPTWSEASEASASDMLDGEAATAGQGKAKAPVAAPDRSLGLTSRFGGWLSGVVSGQGRMKPPQQPFEKALGSLFGDVKTGLQKLAGKDRLINAQDGQVHMEIAALGG